MRLTEFFTEEASRKAVFTFGRMNPPTQGHEKLIAAVEKVAASQNSEAFIVPTKTQDTIKNPLDFSTKVKFLKIFFPQVNIMEDLEIRTVFDAMLWFGENGYNEVIMVVGSDRVTTFQKMISAYVPSLNPSVDPEKALDKISAFSVVNAGTRDPDAEGVAGVSGTKAREFAVNGKENEFVNLVAPTNGTEQQKLALYKAVRKGLGVK